MKKFLKYFTEIDTNELEKINNSEKNINNLKILLANKATTILHGEKKARESEITAKETFRGSGIGLNLPVVFLKSSLFKDGINVVDFLNNTKILNSKSGIRRAINENSIKINDVLITDEKKIINLSDFTESNCIKVSHGKKKHFKIKLN